jgi:hypothetical protein
MILEAKGVASTKIYEVYADGYIKIAIRVFQRGCLSHYCMPTQQNKALALNSASDREDNNRYTLRIHT